MTVLNTNIHDLLIGNKPDFADKKLKHFDNVKFFAENFGECRNYIGSVPLKKVIGTTHPKYNGHSWIELLPLYFKSEKNIPNFSAKKNLGILEREQKLIDKFHESPNYYLSEDEKEQMSFYKVEDKFYIDIGNHRTVMARFFLSLNNLPEIIHGISINEFIASKPSFQLDRTFFKW